MEGHHQITTFFIVHKFGCLKILTGQEFGSQISLNIVDEVIEVDKVDKYKISGRQPLVENTLHLKTTIGGR